MTRSLTLLALTLLCLALAAGAQNVPDQDVKPFIKMCSGLTGGCDISSTGYDTNCIRLRNNNGVVEMLPCTANRPRLSDLMPIVEPLPPMRRGKRVLINADSLCNWAEMECFPPPEPMDVPAIQESRMECVIPNQTVASSFQCELSFGSGCPCGSIQPVKHDTCADKSRVLLTDESGARHCIKFGGTQ